MLARTVGGDVIGPNGATANDLAAFDGVTGKVIKDSALLTSDAQTAITNSHIRQHAITATADHTSAATAGQMLKADASGLPIDASNTDTAVADAVSASHTRSHALDGTSDHSIGGLTSAYLVKSDGTKLAPATNTDADVSSAVSLKHTQGTDTALGAVGTKDPPIDADKVIYRNSVAADALVTSTWTQVKAFLKTYFDTLYVAVTGRYRYAAALADAGTTTLPTITANWPAHGFIHCAHTSTGEISESAEFEYGSTGEVQIIRGTANIEANGATAGKISLGAAESANPVVIKNNLGGGVSVNTTVYLWYN